MAQLKPTYIEVAELSDRSQYSNFCRVKAPIFFLGEKINCKLIIETLEDNQPLKFRGITASILNRVFKDKQLLSETIIASHKFKEDSALVGNGIIDKPHTIYNFAFDGVQFSMPSYFGCRYQLLYYIQIIIHLRWKPDIITEKHILLLEPEANYIPKSPVSQFIDHENVSFNVYFDKGSYSLSDIIHGQIAFADMTSSNLSHISMNVVVSETFNGKTDETCLLEYEVMDGCPRSGTTVPFLIQLQPFRLSYIKEGKNTPITSQFFIEIEVKCKNNLIFTSRQYFNLFLPQTT